MINILNCSLQFDIPSIIGVEVSLTLDVNSQRYIS